MFLLHGRRDAGLYGGRGFYANTAIMGHLATVDERCLPHTGAEVASSSSPSFPPAPLKSKQQA